MGIVDKAKQAAIAATVTKALDYLEKDPETNIPKIMEMVDKVTRMAGMQDREMRSVIPSRQRTTGIS